MKIAYAVIASDYRDIIFPRPQIRTDIDLVLLIMFRPASAGAVVYPSLIDVQPIETVSRDLYSCLRKVLALECLPGDYRLVILRIILLLFPYPLSVHFGDTSYFVWFAGNIQ